MNENEMSAFIYNRIDAQKDVRLFDLKLATQIGVEPSMIFYVIMELCTLGNENVVIADDRPWFMISSETLHQQKYFPWMPSSTIRYNLQKLEKIGLISSRIEANSSNQTKYYTPNAALAYDLIYHPEKSKKPIDKNCQWPIDKNCQCLENDLSINELKRLKIKELKEKRIKDTRQQSETQTVTPRPRDEMFDAIAQITEFDPKLNGSRIAKASNALKKAGYLAADVLIFLEWWKLFDFRWRQSKQLPAPEQVTTLIARSRSWASSTGRSNTQDETGSLYPEDYVPGETLKEYTERKKGNEPH